MSGGGSKPSGGKMGTAIRATSVSAQAIANAENELAERVVKLSNTRQKITDATRCYQALEKTFARMEMELAKSQKEVITQTYVFQLSPFIYMSLLTSYLSTKIIVLIQIDNMNMQIDYLEKQLDSLKPASEPRNDELNRLEELKKIISAEENEIDRLTQGSKQLKEKVGQGTILFFILMT